MGEKLDKRPQVTELKWGLGAVGMAEWRGVPLRHVLEAVGIKENAFHVCATGGESDSREGELKIPLPIKKAMDPDTILAIRMNGQQLPTDHGFPVRLIVPGWVGAYSIKWIKQLEVFTEPIWVTRNTEFYVLMGDDWPEVKYAPAKGAPITKLNIKSSLALPYRASLSPGEHCLRGFARSSGAKITSVEWSDDQGASWYLANLGKQNYKYGWVRFEFNWTATPGMHSLKTRATDSEGITQPRTIPFNKGGYLFNTTHAHPIKVG